MNWYYSENNGQRGPLNENEFEFLVRAGKITPDTMVWRKGMADWQPWREVRPEEPSGQIPPPVETGALQTPGGTGDASERNGPPWEHRGSLGVIEGAVETVKAVLEQPSGTFAGMKRAGGLSDPLCYALLVGGVGSYVGCIYNVAIRHFGIGAGSLGNINNNEVEQLLRTNAGMAYALIAALFLVPVGIVLGTFINSAIMHLCLILLGGAKQPFETTYRVVCYSLGSTAILQVIPVCGGLICGVWNLVTTCIGLARAHEIPTGKAVAAVLLPLILCCGLLVALVPFFLGFYAASAARQ